jgi:hypothetical protein
MTAFEAVLYLARWTSERRLRIDLLRIDLLADGQALGIGRPAVPRDQGSRRQESAIWSGTGSQALERRRSDQVHLQVRVCGGGTAIF